MIRSLDIRNYVLIENLHLGFGPGLSVITGETGAGKSILLGALSLILGQRASFEVMRDPGTKCVIEGTFGIAGYGLEAFFEANGLDYAEETILRREILPSGKSRAFINDSPVTLQQMKDLGEQLVDIHSQHRTLALNAADVQLTLLDEYAGQEDLVQGYAQTWERYRKLTGNLELLRQEEIRFAQERDYHQFLFDELQSAALQEGESEELGHELARMRHAESLQQALFFSVNALVEADGNIDQQLRDVIHRLNEAGKHLPEAGELAGRLESLRIEARDASDELVRLRDMAWPDPSLLAGYEERLDLIYRLLRKHGAADEHALLELMENLGKLLAEGSDRQQEMRLLEKELKQTEELLLLQADGLHKGREAHQAELSAHLLSIIQRLGMPEASFEIKLEALDHPGPQGTERARFLFNANRGGKAAELSHVASGGERSRLMLAIKSCITQRNVLPTIIFDEIDTGVSGEMAQKTGQIMAEMGQRLQVIAITHLPQIAARGEKHYLVFKETDEQSTYTRVHALQSEDRTLEIARMLSGDRPSDAALQTARELMVGSRTTK